MNLLDNVIIVLVRTKGSGNIGAVCRSMMNMGLSRLRLVSPQNVEDNVIRARAVHAESIWNNAEFFDGLKEAVCDCGIAIGTSRRMGNRRKSITMPPRDAAIYIHEKLTSPNGCKPVALVFGNERTGLENDELELCSIASYIPASGFFPSLNLSHAVQIYCYELFMTLESSAAMPQHGKWEPLDKQQVDMLAGSVCQSLESIGFYKITGKETQARFFSDLFGRAGITKNEARYMRSIFAKAARLKAKSKNL